MTWKEFHKLFVVVVSNGTFLFHMNKIQNFKNEVLAMLKNINKIQREIYLRLFEIPM